MQAVPYDMRALTTRGETSATADASFRVEHDFMLGMNTFRILAPEATERTTLKKSDCSDAWSIVDREPLDVEDPALHFVYVIPIKFLLLSSGCEVSFADLSQSRLQETSRAPSVPELRILMQMNRG